MTASNVLQHSQLDTRSNPNLLINGDFSVSQRGTGFNNVVAQYTIDRWFTSSYTASFGNAPTQVATVDDYMYIDSRSVPDAGKTYNQQKVELSPSIIATINEAGVLTHSMEVQFVNSDRTFNFECRFYKKDGSFDLIDFSSEVIPDDGNFHKIVNTFQVNLEDTTSGSEPQFLQLGMSDTDLTGLIGRFKKVKLERGSVATPFIPDDPATNLAKCQRYFQRFNSISVNGMVHQNGDTRCSPIVLPTTMRVAPQCIASAGSVLALWWGWAAEQTNVGHTFEIRSIEPNFAYFYWIGTLPFGATLGSNVGFGTSGFNFTADAEL